MEEMTLLGCGFRGQLFIFEILGFNKCEDCITKKIGIFAVVKSEAHFFEVGLEMFCTEFMPATAQPALEQRERRFDGIGMGVPAHIFLDAVLNHLMLFVN
jgi:hypothetical protein